MHVSLALGNIPALTRARKGRRVLVRSLSRLAITRYVVLAVCGYITYAVTSRVILSNRGIRSPPDISQTFSACLSQPTRRLTTFDPFAQTLQSTGVPQNHFETRHQEQLWDTIIGPAVFPAYSDMEWNIPQYSRALSSDLRSVQQLAARSVGHGLSVDVAINYIHRRLDRLRGLQYVVNYGTRTASADSANSSYTMLVQRRLEESSCELSLKRADKTDMVYILVPYKGREERLRRFMRNYVEMRKLDENIVLVISVLKRSRDVEFVRALKREMSSTNEMDIIKSIWLHENDGDVEGGFSRGVALREAAKLAVDSNAVLFQCDVDMIVRQGFFERCRQNSVRGAQVYYPVFYSLFAYATGRATIAERNGFWRKTSFGMACMRKGDFERVGAYNDAETRFHGWGSEDVYQFERVRNMSGGGALVAFRAVEPALLHDWHLKKCDETSVAYKDCMKTNFVTMGDPIRVGPVLLQSLRNVDEFFATLTGNKSP